MITDKDKKIILKIARKYRATRVVLFGSALSTTIESRDIDLAVDGVADEDFYAFYGELMCMLSKPVDIIDLSIKSKFTDLVLQEGVPLHTFLNTQYHAKDDLRQPSASNEPVCPQNVPSFISI